MARIIIHNHLPKRKTKDADFTNFDAWAKAVLAKYPGAKIQQERLKDGFAKVAFLENKVVGKYTMGGTKARSDGWVTGDASTLSYLLKNNITALQGDAADEPYQYAEGKKAAEEGKSATPPYPAGSEPARRWKDGYASVKKTGDAIKHGVQRLPSNYKQDKPWAVVMGASGPPWVSTHATESEARSAAARADKESEDYDKLPHSQRLQFRMPYRD